MTLVSSTTSSVRGDIRIQLTSPSGTQSTLLDYRYLDDSSELYERWPFMSVMFWGENPEGQWTLTIQTQDAHTLWSALRVALQVTQREMDTATIQMNPCQCVIPNLLRTEVLY